MFRLWGKIWKDNHLLKDTVICDDSEDTRTHKIFHGLESICYEMDLGNPIWLDSTVKHFKKHGKARFYQDNFIEQIDFDYLELEVIEDISRHVRSDRPLNGLFYETMYCLTIILSS